MLQIIFILLYLCWWWYLFGLIWLTIYGLNVIFCKLLNMVSYLCAEKKEKLYVQENLNVKKVVEIVVLEYFWNIDRKSCTKYSFLWKSVTVCGFLRTVELYFKSLFSSKLCPVILKTTYISKYRDTMDEYLCLQ